MHISEALDELVEGRTKMIIPREAVTEDVPPKKPAFFNPRAKLSRDLSLVVYDTLLKNFEGPKIFLDGLSGIGARGLRVANELQVDSVVVNDLNPSAITMAKASAKLNGITNMSFSKNEVCRFLSEHSERDKRGTIIDIDPFGSPAQFFDCGLRATIHGGMLSCTATDLQVLSGIFPDACRRRYGGVPIKAEYRNEIAIRLILGCMRAVAGRLGLEIIPLFVESNMHYYRTYVKVMNRRDQKNNLGFITHCNSCKQRGLTLEMEIICSVCNSKTYKAGPLWIGDIFEKDFVRDMTDAASKLEIGRNCEKILAKSTLEAGMPGTYYTVDEIASCMKSSPPKLDSIVTSLQDKGFASSPTSLNPTGFRTEANADKVKEMFVALTDIA